MYSKTVKNAADQVIGRKWFKATWNRWCFGSGDLLLSFKTEEDLESYVRGQKVDGVRRHYYGEKNYWRCIK